MMERHDQQSRKAWCIFAAFISIFILFLLAPVACDNGGGGDAHSDGSPPGDDNDWAQNLASGGASAGIEALLEAAELPLPDFLVESVVGSIIGKLFNGGSSPDTQMLNQIYSALTDIEEELTAIAEQLSHMEDELALDTATINTTIQKTAMDTYVVQINTQWDSYLSLRSVDSKGNVTWDKNPQDLQELADGILACSGGVYSALVGIHDMLTQEENVSTGTLSALSSYARSLVINGKADPFTCYMIMENYFGSILQAESRGATLMVEALRYREASNQTTLEDCPAGGNAADFMAWYTDHIEDQVEVFLNSTEQFVTSIAYPQKGFGDFAPEADKIFYRADLIAAWLSHRHRLNPGQPPNGQAFMVYRVIGGPDRVAQHGTGFAIGGSAFNSILYNATTTPDQYDLATYNQASHHAYSALRSGTSPYVQFMHPLDNSGGAKQKGAIADATEIWTGAYVAAADKSGAHSITLPYYLSDIPTHSNCTVQYQYVNSAGNTPASGEDQILFGYCLDIQHPPAMLMGDWKISLSHDSQSGLQYGLAHWLDGSATPGSQWVYLGVDAWPTVTHDQYWYYPTGDFQQENAMVGVYYWGGSTCCPVLGTNYTASMAWNIQNNGAPADRDCGTLLWVARSDQSNSYGDYDYDNVGSGTDTVKGRVAVNMVPTETFYISLGAHMFVDWTGNNVNSDADWHHWDGNYKISLQELHFDMPQ